MKKSRNGSSTIAPSNWTWINWIMSSTIVATTSRGFFGMYRTSERIFSQEILSVITIHVQGVSFSLNKVFIACGASEGQERDPFRKPQCGMWRIIEQRYNTRIPIAMCKWQLD